MPATVELINLLCSVSTNGNQIHKHTFTCYKRNDKECRFNIPYWPMDRTRMLLPMESTNSRRSQLKAKGREMHERLNIKVYTTLDEYLSDCNCSYDNYLDVIRASLQRPTVLLKRSMEELWTNPYNPWVANQLLSNMDLQFIMDEYSCAAYVVEYVNKTNRGISNLHLELIKLQEEYPDQDYCSLLKKVSIKMLNSVEMCAQEAAWYLLRQPMSEASRKVEFIPTMWPHERIKSRKHTKRMDEEGINDDSTDVWTLNIIQKYEKREGLDDICLADFVSCYTKDRSSINTYKRRSIPRIVRWRKYKMTELNDFKREMVLLFQPFRNETCDILDRNNFIELYDQNEAFILNKLKEYDCNINLQHIVEEYLRINEEIESDDLQNETNDKHNEFVRAIVMEPNDDDIEQLPTGALSAVVKKRTNVMSKLEYCAMVRATNVEQRNLILHLIDILHSFDGMNIPLQIFFTGPAGCGKTFTLRILMETYNRFSQSHNSLKKMHMLLVPPQEKQR
ncbi:uncharacterized protein LOC131677981 [Topomyia yanbarensis]|uniref:uncharacterized protein LOC131677981 n=1 Tax=Topomyia yanbarensis TaxID=2498891 RepID=UPI00273AFB6F|nr:uncharacterized protein LOC131677981 [Topomyia yanbarensis]XP_058814075.1 uncharacterized protein LOC131677981 [Topomyia yanbarensis]XP_058814076.1 uncharacterized protein LOC131677981 [Topomyia yanbarensis]XP_058814077.1 uncharacterized protein LOC131677981 [Topomyia yanbarensis]